LAFSENVMITDPSDGQPQIAPTLRGLDDAIR
jgi:hypothetical protein